MELPAGQGGMCVRDTDGEDQELMPSSLGLICQMSQQSPLSRIHIMEMVQRTQHGTWDTRGTWQVSAFFFLFLTTHTLSFTPPQTAAVMWAEQGARSWHQTNAMSWAQPWSGHTLGSGMWALSVPSLRVSVRECRVLHAAPVPPAPRVIFQR